MGKLSPPTRLTAGHDISAFESDEPALNDWLRRKALGNEDSGACRTYVVCNGHRVVGFYSLATGAIDHISATGKTRRNMPNPVPVIVLGRMAVDRAWAGKGVGRGMIKDATLRALQASEVVGVRAILVHAKSEKARDFYVQKCGLAPSPVDPMTLMITLADAAAAIRTG